MECRPSIAPDTNVLVSARLQIQFRKVQSPSVVLVQAVMDGRVRLFTSAPLLFELAAALQKPHLKNAFGLTDVDAVEWMAVIANLATGIVKIGGADLGCRDPKDNKIIETARNARVDYLVGRDGDVEDPKMVALLGASGVQVVNVGKFLHQFFAGQE